MIGLVRDTWRAVLVVVVVVLLREILVERPAAAPQPPLGGNAMYMPPPVHMNPWQQMQVPQVIMPPQEPERPLRRVAAAMTELGDSILKVIR